MRTDKKWKGLLMAMTILALSFATFSCDDDDEDNAAKRNYVVAGNASGSQVVPAVSGTGTGTMNGTYNPTTRELNYTTTWTGLTGAPTGGGFYNGANGVNGEGVGTAWTFDANATDTGTRTGKMTLTQAQADQLLSGNWYYTYNTVTNANGEIRGQMTATQQN